VRQIAALSDSLEILTREMPSTNQCWHNARSAWTTISIKLVMAVKPLADCTTEPPEVDKRLGSTASDIHFPVPLPDANRNGTCECIACRFPGSSLNLGTPKPQRKAQHCLFPGCSELVNLRCSLKLHSSGYIAYWKRTQHEKSHYAVEGGGFSCRETGCNNKTKRFSDLLRHCASKHCNKNRKTQCPVLGCKYNGEGNGFIRKDKLKSHYKAVHEGRAPAPKIFQAIEPKAEGM